MVQWEYWLEFVIDRWFVIVLAVIALIVVVKLVKTIVKWLLVIAIVGALVFYGATYTDAIKEVGGKIIEYTQDELFDLMTFEINEAEYSEDANGRFSVTSGNLKLEGHADEEDVVITYRGQSITIKKNDFLERYIAEVKGR